MATVVVVSSQVTITDKKPLEGSSSQLIATLRDQTSTVIPGASLSLLKLTLYDRGTDGILNARDHQSILGVNGGSVDVNGVLTLDLSYLDNIIVNQSVGEEAHIALIEYEWNAGAKRGKVEITFFVVNLNKVP